MTRQIRQLTQNDEPLLQAWAANFSPSPAFNWEPQTLVDTLKESEIWGLFQGGSLMSAVAYQLVADFREILWLATHPEFEGQGYMKQLLRHGLDNASSNLQSILLEVHEGNPRALALYTQLGFKRVGIRKNYYRDGANALLLTFPVLKTRA